MDIMETTLCCVFDRERGSVLMIESRRGIGEGYVNFPGGKQEPGETALACCIRETGEETGIVPADPRLAGLLEFAWPDKNRLVFNQVFIADGFSGALKEADAECAPMWLPEKGIPLDRMWPSDRIWLPALLSRRPFHFEFRNPKSPEPEWVRREISLPVEKAVAGIRALRG